MKTFFESYSGRRFLLLLGFMLLAAVLLAHQSRRHFVLKERATKTTVAMNQTKLKEAALLAERAASAEQIELLASYEKRIPLADNGYVWVSRVVRDAVPNLALKISPPEFEEQQAPLSGEYCCGTFDVRGTGRLDELLQVLQKVEAEMPFARVRDLHFAFVADQVEFSFSLMAVMRFNQDVES